MAKGMSEPIGDVGWPGGAKAAISLTYDGGLPDHLLIAKPLLEALDISATFYLSATAFVENPRSWIGMAQRGHEIGNHSLYGVTGMRGELPNWTLEMVDDDLQMTEALLREHLPGPPERSFAYPGDLPLTAEGSYEGIVESHFHWARSLHDGLNHAIFCNPHSLLSVTAADLQGPQLIRRAEEALELGAWVIFVFGGFNSRTDASDADEHEMLLRHLTKRRQHFHIAPVREVAIFVTEARERMIVG